MCAKLLLLWRRVCAKLLLMWQMNSVCKAFVIVVNEECVQSFCYCRD